MENKTEHVLIIGGGPAGLASAVYTARASLNPLVIAGSPPGGQLMLTTEVENYPGYESILGPELVTKFRSHAKKFNVRILDQNVVKVNFSRKPFEVSTSDATYSSHSVIVATGAKALWLNLPSEQLLRGKGVSACATCDGFFFRNKIVAVVGGGDTAMEEALTLTKFANKVYVIHRRDEFRASKIMQERVKNHPKIEIKWSTTIAEVLGKNKVEGLLLNTKEKLVLDGLFLAIGHKPDTDVFKDQINLDQKGYIMTSSRLAEDILTGKQKITASQIESAKKQAVFFSTMTSVAGVFAAGDCVDYNYRQAGTSVGMGIEAALDAERWLETR